MGTVNITQRLMDEVDGNIKRRMEPKVRAIYAEIQQHADVIYRGHVSAEEESGCLPRFSLYAEYLSVSLPEGGGTVPVKLGTKRPVPLHHNGYSLVPATYTPKLEDECYPILEDIVRRAKHRQKELTDLLQGARDTMNKCANMKQLVQIWPSVIEFVGEETLKRHNAPSSKNRTKFDPEANKLSTDVSVLVAKTLMTT